MQDNRVSYTTIRVGLVLILTVGLALFYFNSSTTVLVSTRGSSTMATTGLDDAPPRLSRTRERLTRYKSYYGFLSSCTDHNVIPEGMKVGFGTDAVPRSDYLLKVVGTITLQNASKAIMHTCRNSYGSLIRKETGEMHLLLYQISQHTTFLEFRAILEQHRLRSKPNALLRRNQKKRKLKQLIDQKKQTQQETALDDTNGRKRKARRFKRRADLISQRAGETQCHANGDKNTVVNLSNTRLTEGQTTVLSLGPNVCPTPRSLDHLQLATDVSSQGYRKVCLKVWHCRSDSESDEDEAPTPPKFYKPTGFVPPSGRDIALEAYCQTLQSRTDNYEVCARPRDNLSGDQRRALDELREMVHSRLIRISVADTGGAVVVQDTTEYIAEINRQLKNEAHYCKVEKDPTSQIAKTSNQLAEQLHEMGNIDETTRRWALVEPSKVQCHRLYTLPKIHKTLMKPPGRPIVSGTNGPTETLSRLVDHWLQDHAKGVPSYIQDTTDMLRTIQQWNHAYGPFGDHVKLVTIDVVGLYTSLPHDELQSALRFHLNSRRRTDVSLLLTESIIGIIDHILSNNVFTFENEFFQQTFGTAMGTPMAPPVLGVLNCNHCFSPRRQCVLFRAGPVRFVFPCSAFKLILSAYIANPYMYHILLSSVHAPCFY